MGSMAIKKKLLFLSPTLKGGGAERFVTILLRHIDRRKFTSVLGVVGGVASFVYKVASDIEIIDLKSKRVRYALLKIVRLVRVKNPDILFWAAAILVGYPCTLVLELQLRLCVCVSQVRKSTLG